MALQQPDLDWLALAGAAHASGLAQDLGRAHPGAYAAHDVLVENADRRTFQVAGPDLTDEARNIDAGRAGLDTGCVEAEVAPAALDESLPVIERRLEVVEVPGEFLAAQDARRDRRPLCHRVTPSIRAGVVALSYRETVTRPRPEGQSSCPILVAVFADCKPAARPFRKWRRYLLGSEAG